MITQTETGKGGIYTWWYYFRKGEETGQVATLITLAIAVIFLFVAVTLNISRVAQKKTTTANAADGAAIRLASGIGSYANKLSWEYFDGKTKKCQRRWGTLFMVLSIVALAVIAYSAFALATSPQTGAAMAKAAGAAQKTTIDAALAEGLTMSPQLMSEAMAAGKAAAAEIWAASGGSLGNLATTGAWTSGGGAGANEFAFEPRVAARLQGQMNKLSLGMNLAEQAILYALRNTVDDPGQRNDWYMQRADQLAAEAEALRANIAEFVPQIEYFAQVGDGFRREFSEDATRPLILEGEGDEQEIVTADEDGEFITLLEDLSQEGLQVSFWRPGADSEQNSDEVDELSSDLDLFYLWAQGAEDGLLHQDLDNMVLMYDMWMPQLYDPQEAEAWYDTWQEQAQNIVGWQQELYAVDAELEDMIEEETDPLRKDYLQQLQERTTSGVRTLDSFEDNLRDFNSTTLAYYQQIENSGSSSGGTSSSIGSRQASYSWHDSLGQHNVHVSVSNFKMPRIKVKKSFMKICMYLKDYKGDVNVTVTRYDQSTAASFARRASTPLWKFRYASDAQGAGGITSSASARYTYNSLPKLTNVR